MRHSKRLKKNLITLAITMVVVLVFPITGAFAQVPGFAIEPLDTATTPLQTSEAGTTETFTVALTSQPSADVTVGLSSSNTNEGTISPPSLTFTDVDWGIPQTATITGMADDMVDGNMNYIIFLTASSSDEDYDVLDPPDVYAINANIDTPGVTVTLPTDLMTSEDGKQVIFTVRLNSEPTANVTIPLSVSNSAEGEVAPQELVFTPYNWNGLQPVTATGVDDIGETDGDQTYDVILGQAVSADTNYSGYDADDISLTNRDNDVPGVIAEPLTGLVTGEDGTSATFTVRLNSVPTADVTIDISSSNSAEGSVSPIQLTFTPTNWSGLQTVTINGMDDTGETDGDQPYTVTLASPDSADSGYSMLSPINISVTNTDNDTPGIIVTPNPDMIDPITGRLMTTEYDKWATFTVKLNSKPTEMVFIDYIYSNNTLEGVVTNPALIFTPLTWNIPQTVTIKGIDDDPAVEDGDQEYTVIIPAAASLDPNYDTLDAEDDVDMINMDDDSPGIMVMPTSGLETSEEGGTAVFTVNLKGATTDTVTIELTSSDIDEGTVSPSPLIFTPSNWYVAQEVTVTGVDDTDTDGNQSYKILFSPAASLDLEYNGMMPTSDVSLVNLDDDTPEVLVEPVSGLETSEDGTSVSFTVKLNTAPTSDVTIAVSSSNTDEGTVSPDTLTFTSLNWNALQVVTVTGVDDAGITDGNQTYTVVLDPAVSDDTNYNGIDPPDVALTNLDNNTPGIKAEISGNTSENEDTATLTISLQSQPTANVTVNITSGDATEGVPVETSLMFTTDDWNSLKTVTVTGKDDTEVDGDMTYFIELEAVSTDSNYDTLGIKQVTLVNTDNDIPGFDVSLISQETTEDGGTATFTVVLKTQVSGTWVTIPTIEVLAENLPDDTSTEASVSPTSLTFSKDNWNAAQTVTVTGQDDFIADGNQSYTIELGAATSDDPAYVDVKPPTVSGVNLDNEVPQVMVSIPEDIITDEAGTKSGVFYIELIAAPQPGEEVTITLSSSDSSEGTVSPDSVVFTDANWDSPQTITVTGADDEVADGNQKYTIITEPASSTSQSSGYDGIDPADVTAVNEDDNDSVVPLPGDIVTDGTVDLRDAIAALQILVGLTPTVDLNYDACEDGKIGMKDAIYILRIVLGT